MMRLNWDFECAEGRERLRVYRQTLMAGHQAAARKPTNLSKVNLIRQEPNESLAAFLERLMEAFRQYTPMDPQADEPCTAVLLRAAEKVFNNRETPEEREGRIRWEERKFRAKEN